MNKQPLFNRQIALPQDHGSWVFIFSPLLIGIFASGSFNYASLALTVAALAAFFIRQPSAMMVKAYAGRRPRGDLPVARFWFVVYGVIALLALAELFYLKQGYIALLAVPGIPVFAWHLYLVSKRAERRQAGVEVIATGVLSLVAPAAFWVGRGGYDSLGWWLWALTWLQSAASIVYAYVRLEQREHVPQAAPASSQERSERWKMGRRAFVYTSFNLAVSVMLGWSQLLPQWIFLPFLLQWLETVWGIQNPATYWKPTRIGIRQLIVSTLWTILFIVAWRL
ncbi:MAG: YwiC-like family protein [Chloroflexi bacterium]|nr:YwiC-like family protein [Chloroflexota bacterium]